MSNKEIKAKDRFFSNELFEKIKKYLTTANRDDPPVIGSTENFCEPDPPREESGLDGEVRIDAPVKIKKGLSMEEALAETHPGHADLVNKLIEEESDE